MPETSTIDYLSGLKPIGEAALQPILGGKPIAFAANCFTDACDSIEKSSKAILDSLENSEAATIANLLNNGTSKEAVQASIGTELRDFKNSITELNNQKNDSLRNLATEFDSRIKGLMPDETKHWSVNQRLNYLQKMHNEFREKITAVHQHYINQPNPALENYRKKLVELYPDIFGDSDETKKRKATNQLFNLKERSEKEMQSFLGEIKRVYLQTIEDVYQENYQHYNKLVQPVPSGSGTFANVRLDKNKGVYIDRYEDEIAINKNEAKFNFTDKKYTEKEKREKLLDCAMAIRHKALTERAETIAQLKADGKLEEIEKLPPLSIKITAIVKDRRRFIANTQDNGEFTNDVQQTKALLSMQWRACIQAGYKQSEIQSEKGFQPTQADLGFAHRFAALESYKPLIELTPRLYTKLANDANNQNKHLQQVPVLSESAAFAISQKFAEFVAKESVTPSTLTNLRNELDKIQPNFGTSVLGQNIAAPADPKLAGKDFNKAANLIRDMRADKINNPEVREFLRDINANQSKKYNSSQRAIQKRLTNVFNKTKAYLGYAPRDYLIDKLKAEEIEKINNQFLDRKVDMSSYQDVLLLKSCLNLENQNLFDKFYDHDTSKDKATANPVKKSNFALELDEIEHEDETEIEDETESQQPDNSVIITEVNDDDDDDDENLNDSKQSPRLGRSRSGSHGS